MQVRAGTELWLIQKETQDSTTSSVEGTYVSRMKNNTFLRSAKCSTSLGYSPEGTHTCTWKSYQVTVKVHSAKVLKPTIFMFRCRACVFSTYTGTSMSVL